MRMDSHITTIINGETGVGKTCLVQYLSNMTEGMLFTLNVHAGREQQSIIDFIKNDVIRIKNSNLVDLDYIKEEIEKREQTDSN